MHKLFRTQPEPSVLTTARANQTPDSDWDHFSTAEKKIVRDALLNMQNYRCAYCERTIQNESTENENKYNGHIEHFRRKDSCFHPEFMFVWDNLFYSCLTRSTCGKRKDRVITKKEQYALLIDPCKDKPEDFFVFDIKGRIAIRSNLSESDRKRAEFTIAVFGLNDPQLIQMRINFQKKYQWLKQFPNQVSDYLTQISPREPFITAIYHFLGKRFVP